jgi:hypothetical protein
MFFRDPPVCLTHRPYSGASRVNAPAADGEMNVTAMTSETTA